MVESMAGEWLGFDDISARTGIPSTSLRRWARQFRKHLGSKIIGRAEKFPLESLKTFGQIAEMFSRRMSRVEVQAVLERIEVRTLDVDQVVDQVRQVAPQGADMVKVLARIADSLEGIVAAQGQTLDILARHLEGAGTPQAAPVTRRSSPATAARTGRPDALAKVMELHGQGLGSRAIARQLEADGWPTLSGKGRWARGIVQKLLREGGVTNEPGGGGDG